MSKLPLKRTHGLTPAQHNAIDLLITGGTDAYIAEAVGVTRTTVTRWRLHDPLFQVEFNRRRAEAWGGAANSLRCVIPLALDTMRDQLRVGPSRGRLALDLLTRLGLMGKPNSGALGAPAGPDNPLGLGPTTLDELLDAEVRRARTEAAAEFDDAPDTGPVSDDEREAALQYLLAQSTDGQDDCGDDSSAESAVAPTQPADGGTRHSAVTTGPVIEPSAPAPVPAPSAAPAREPVPPASSAGPMVTTRMSSFS